MELEQRKKGLRKGIQEDQEPWLFNVLLNSCLLVYILYVCRGWVCVYDIRVYGVCIHKFVSLCHAKYTQRSEKDNRYERASLELRNK